MDQELTHIFAEQYEKLPTVVKNYIASGKWQAPLEQIMNEHSLTQEQKDILAEHFAYFLYGMEYPIEFVQNIYKELGTPEKATETILERINRMMDPEVMTELLAFEMPQEIIDQIPDDEIEHMKKRVESEEDEEEQVPTKEPEVARAPSSLPITAPANLPTGPIKLPSFMEKKMSQPIRTAPQVTERKIVEPSAPTPPVPPAPSQGAEKKYGSDPYREPLG